uniref:Uncharacterized protein n=1 Tax=Cucumis melo TaxID=3656 RepID=A0A9I9E5T5_CUCME
MVSVHIHVYLYKLGEHKVFDFGFDRLGISGLEVLDFGFDQLEASGPEVIANVKF